MRDVGAVARFVSALVVLSLVAVAAGAAWGQEAPDEAAVQTVVLNTYGIWRFHCTLEDLLHKWSYNVKPNLSIVRSTGKAYYCIFRIFRKHFPLFPLIII